MALLRRAGGIRTTTWALTAPVAGSALRSIYQASLLSDGTTPVGIAGSSAGAAAASGTVSVQAQSAVPQLVSLAPSPVTIGQTLTVTADLTPWALAGSAAGQAAATGALALPQSATPTLSGLAPNPVTAGQTLTVTVELTPSGALAGSSAGVGAATGHLRAPVVLPGTLGASQRDGGTATPAGEDLAFTAGQWVEWVVDAGAGGTFVLSGTIAGSAVAAQVLVDTVQVDSWAIP